MVLALVCLSLTLGWEVFALPAPGRNSIVTPGGQTTPCTYDNYQDSGKFLGRDCTSGDNKFSESTALALWNDEIANNVKIFFEAGTWDMVNGATITGVSAITGVTVWGVYNATVIKCSVNACAALAIGNQNAVDSVYHAKSIFLHDLTFDGGAPSVTNGRALSITTAYDVQVDHVILENAQEMATGGFAATNWNNQQIRSQFIFVRNSLFLAIKIGVSGLSNGYMEFNSFVGMPPNPTHRALVDFSKADISPVSINMLSNFDFDHNTATGWSDCSGGFMAGFEANNNDTISSNYVDTCMGFTTVAVMGPICNAIVIAFNVFVRSTGIMHFTYCNNVEITGNQWLTDSTPAGGSIALQIDGGACGAAGENACPTDFLIHHNQVVKWGAGSFLLNFTRGLVDSNDIYDGNQVNGNANSNAEITIYKGLAGVHINDNILVSDVTSGPGTSRPINYAGAAQNLTLTTNYFYYAVCGTNLPSQQACDVIFTATPTSTVQMYSNYGENPFDKVANPFIAGFVGLCGTGATPSASTDYVVCGFPILVTSTAGTGVAIVIKDGAGNTVWSPGATLSGYFVPLGYKVNFGAFSVAPTVTVFGN